MPKHFMRIRDLGHSGAWEIIRRAKEMKETNYRGHCMDGKVAALIFEKASTRTRVSFDVAVRQLGGTTIFMTPAESQLGRSEPLRDTARVLSRYVDCLIVRTFGQEKLDELAEYGSLPVVNALTDQGHPCLLYTSCGTPSRFRSCEMSSDVSMEIVPTNTGWPVACSSLMA